jgi:uncharacterized protein (DUF2236 family)
VSEDGGQRGYFSAESAVWRIARESILMLGGGYALLMQAAHPLVAAGVVAHSSFKESPWRRLAGTMSAVYTVVYGTRAEADRVAANVRAIHAGVQGSIPEHRGLYPAGTRYAAHEPRLLLWVHGTLVDTALVMHETFVRPLGEEQRKAFYEDMKVVAQLFGTPPSVIPSTFSDFQAYQRERLASGEIVVTDAAREVAETVLHPPVTVALRPALEALGLLTAGLLPASLREQYDLPWDRARAALFAASARALRRAVLPVLPDIVRAVGLERRARDRRTLPFDPLTTFAREANGEQNEAPAVPLARRRASPVERARRGRASGGRHR